MSRKSVLTKAVAGFFLSLVLSVPVTLAEASAERPEGMPEVELSTSYMTKYIWRGWNLGDRPVVQMEGSLSKWGLTTGVWANYSTNSDKSRDEGRYQEFTELDYWVDYTFGLSDALKLIDQEGYEVTDNIGFSAGYTYYTFPDVETSSPDFDSHEVYLGVFYDYMIEPSFTWYYDMDSGDGSYFLFGLAYDHDLTENISANFGIGTGYIDHQWTDESGWGDMVFSTGLDIPVLEYFTISPEFAYSVILDSDTYEGVSDNEFYGGLTVGFAY